MTPHVTARVRPALPVWSPAPLDSFVPTRPIRGTMTLRHGENFAGPRGLEVATVETGSIALEVTTATGIELTLRSLLPGDVVIPLDLVESPAFSLAYRSDATTRIAFMRSRTGHPGRAVESERMILAATTELLAVCIRMIHELACLPAPHRLYCELLRMAGRAADGDSLGTFAMPTHATLATRLCTTRETISRELSFLRRNKVLAEGKMGTILKPDFLLNRLASILNLDANEVWRAIGLPGRRQA